MLDEARRPAPDVLAALPIFPLPNAVLLPGMVLPLNVFESRYLDLVDHALEHGEHVGIPMLKPGYEASYAGRPAIEPVFGVGKLVAHKHLQDGRRFIRVECIGRALALRELAPRTTFREVVCELLPEEEPAVVQGLEVLKAQVERIALTLDDEDAEVLDAVRQIPDPRVMIYAIAAIVPNVDPTFGVDGGNGRCPRLELQQRILDAETSDDRVRLLLDHSASLCTELGESGRFPVAAYN